MAGDRYAIGDVVHYVKNWPENHYKIVGVLGYEHYDLEYVRGSLFTVAPGFTWNDIALDQGWRRVDDDDPEGLA